MTCQCVSADSWRFRVPTMSCLHEPAPLIRMWIQEKDQLVGNALPTPWMLSEGSLLSTFFFYPDDLAFSREKQGTSVFMSGYLVKQGGNRKNWKKRFCVLTAESISYYAKKKVIGPIWSRLFDVLTPLFPSKGSCTYRRNPSGRNSCDCTREPHIASSLLCAAYKEANLLHVCPKRRRSTGMDASNQAATR